MTPRLGRTLATALLATLALFTTAVRSVPPTREEIAQWCLDAEDPSHCGRLIEEHQMKRLPGLAKRDGAVLQVARFPSGSTTFTDIDDNTGSTSYSLWDTLDPINAVVLYVTRNDRTSFVVMQRNTGKQAEMAADPVLSSDRTLLATADFCAAECSNEVVLWRVTRDGITREATWKPQPAWSDAGVRWKDNQTLIVNFTAMGSTEGSTQERKLGDPVWRKVAP